jgi:hypothetical protein
MAQKTPTVDPQVKLALDRFLMGLWSERDLESLTTEKSERAIVLSPLLSANPVDRPRASEELRQNLFGSRRPTDLEQFEALIRQGVDCVEKGMPVLSELQHDLLARLGAVARDDGRALAARAIADYAASSQVNIAIQEVGKLAEATTGRVARAREETLKKLKDSLAQFPHLRPTP